MTPRTFVHTESNDEALAPLSYEQSAKLLLPDLPPVSYVDLSHYGNAQHGAAGYCSAYPNMPHLGGGEVVIDSNQLDTHMLERTRKRRMGHAYVYAIARRLTPNDGQGAVYASVLCALIMRAQDMESPPYFPIQWDEVKDAVNTGAALDHAIEFGLSHKDSGVPALELRLLASVSWSAVRAVAWRRALADAEALANVEIEAFNGEAARHLRECETLVKQANELAAEAAAEQLATDGRQANAEVAIREAEAAHYLDWWQIAALFFVVGVICWSQGMAMR